MRFENMNRRLRWCFSTLCLLLVQATTQFVLAQTEPFLREGMNRTEGMLPVYADTDKIYLEIHENLLGRDILLYAQINNGVGLIGRPLSSIGVVRFTKGKEGQLCLSRGICSERFSRKTDDLFTAFEHSTLQPVDIIYQVVGVTTGKGYVIDITDVLKQGNDWFDCKLKNLRGQDVGQSYLKEVKAISDGVRFSYIRSYRFMPSVPSGIKAYEGLVPLEIGCVLRVLPEEKMRVRYEDPRVGYRTVQYVDYGRNRHEAESVSVINRWRLEPKKNDRIVFYIDASCPVELVPFIANGVKAWNSVFEIFGFRDVLEVKKADETMDLTAERAVISYDFGQPEIEHHLFTDPFTGEILTCRINIGHGVLANHLSDYFLQCGNVDSRIRKDREDHKIAGAILQHLISREIGFVLGLKANCAGHEAFSIDQIRNSGWLKKNGYSASILDENPFNYVLQPGDDVMPEFLYPRISCYDKWAVEWGYREFPGNRNEDEDQESLRRLTDKKAGSPFYKFADCAPGGGKRYRIELTSDRIEALKFGIRNLEGLLRKMQKEEKGAACQWIMDSGCTQYLEYLSKGCSGTVSDRKKMFSFFNDYLFSGVPAWLETSEYWREGRLLPERRMLKTGAEIFRCLLASDNVCDTLFNDLHATLFDGFDSRLTLSAFKMNLQRCYLDIFLEYALNERVMACADDNAVEMLSELKFLYAKIKTLSVGHQEQLTKAHYENMLRICNVRLYDKGAGKIRIEF